MDADQSGTIRPVIDEETGTMANMMNFSDDIESSESKVTEKSADVSSAESIRATDGSMKNDREASSGIEIESKCTSSIDISHEAETEGNQCMGSTMRNEPGGEPDKPKEMSFKKPALLVGPRRGKPGKLRALTNVPPGTAPNDNLEIINDKVESTDSVHAQPDSTTDPEDASEPEGNKSILSSDELQKEKEKQIPLSYKEPTWGGLPEEEYKIEVLKSGVILETIDLMEKSFHVFGRLPTCDVPLAHPTISRYHAIIQYRAVGDEKNQKGLYLYDLGSTHGSFWNGNRIRPNMYVRLRGGHMIRFGCSQRKLILQAPPEDEEEESELTITELKEKRRTELEERERREKERKLIEEEEERLRKEKEENTGIDWGMGEDADEETDLAENPYASTNNEELFLDDPKKTLRGWFEREGYDLQYQTEEKGIGQFLCWVELPIDNVTGRPIRAEALVKGKKKESVIQCALEACRILDRHGVLRQAHHEARKRKTKNWEDEDFYDSDEDNFLDRTGAIEKKRQRRMRMAGKLENTVETYASLLEKHEAIAKQIANIEKDLLKAQKKKNAATEATDEDALDAFMSNLTTAASNKSEMTKMKLELQTLRKEESRLINLVNIAKPANLPALKPQKNVDTTEKTEKSSMKPVPMIGSRKKFKSLAKKSATKTSENETVTSTPMDADKDDDDNEETIDSKSENVNKKLVDNYKASLAAEDHGQISGEAGNKEGNADQSDKDDEVVTHQNSDPEVSEQLEKERQEREDKEAERRKKKNQKRIQHRLEKAEKDKKKGYEQDMFKEDYSMWVPPQDQIGDGKTSLNDKLGY